MDFNETALDVLTRAATMVATDASISFRGEEQPPPSCKKAPSISRSAPGSPIDLRDSPSKELPTRCHKLKRRRELLDYPSLLLASRDRSKRSGSEELNSLHGPGGDSRDSSNSSEMEQAGSDDDCLDEEDGGCGQVVPDDEYYETEESDGGSVTGVRHEGRLLVVRSGLNPLPVDDDAPLDMTTSNRSRSRDVLSSPSPSPPLYFGTAAGAAPTQPLPFCPNPPLYSPYASSAPPPPYHPLHCHPSRRSPPHWPSPASPPTAGSESRLPTSVKLQQQHRPSVIKCASAALGGTGPSPPAHQRAAPFTPPPSSAAVFLRAAEQCAAAVQRNGVAALAAARRSLSDPNPGHLSAPSAKARRGSDLSRPGHRREVLSGVCDPVIDEHFRRSLGKDYPEFLATASSSSSSSPGPGPSSTPATPSSKPTSISITGMSVDDHFAKALGETWLRLQGQIATAPAAAQQPAAVSAAAPAISSSSSLSSSPPSSAGSPSPGPRGDGTVKIPASPLQQPRQSGMVSS